VVDKKIEQRISIAKMKMLRWMSGVTREDSIRIERIRGNIGEASILDNMRGNRLGWFGRVMKREIRRL